MKNVKLVLAPLMLLSCTLASCNSGVGLSYKPLKRLEYKDVDSETIMARFDAIGEAQAIEPIGGNRISNLPAGKGTVTLNYGLAAKGKLKLITPYLSPIDLTNLNAALGDTITISWNEDGYIKINDSRSTSYVIKKNINNEDHYYKCYDVDGNKYKLDITELIIGDSYNNDAQNINYFNNYINVAIARNLGIFTYRHETHSGFGIGDRISESAITTEDDTLEGVGFGLSGFGSYYNWDYKQGVLHQIKMTNYLAPGKWFSSSKSMGMGETIFKYLPLLKLVEGGSYRLASDDDKTASVNVALKNVDLSVIPSLIEGLFSSASEVKPKIKYEGTTDGTLSLDYFVAYANSFINQHELIINADGAKANGYAYTYRKKDGVRVKKLLGYVDASLDASVYLGQQVELDKCEKDDVKLDDYADINIPDVPEAEVGFLPLE